jgi:transposase
LARFTAVLGGRPRARILLEASTESEWVARHLETLGHEVIVADPNYAPMYANRSRRTKTDKRDARTLLDACATAAYRPAHRLSEPRRHVRAELAVRDALVCKYTQIPAGREQATSRTRIWILGVRHLQDGGVRGARPGWG